MKSIEIVPMHLRKMPLKHGGMVPTPSGSRGLRRGGHHGQGRFLKTAGTKNYVGIKYSLRRNSKGEGIKQKLNHMLIQFVVATITDTAVAIIAVVVPIVGATVVNLIVVL